MIQQTSINAFLDLRLSYLGVGRRAEVYNKLKSIGSATDCELMEALGYSDPNKIRPRRKELVDEGLIVEDCKRVCGVTGKTVISWKCL